MGKSEINPTQMNDKSDSTSDHTNSSDIEFIELPDSEQDCQQEADIKQHTKDVTKNIGELSGSAVRGWPLMGMFPGFMGFPGHRGRHHMHHGGGRHPDPRAMMALHMMGEHTPIHHPMRFKSQTPAGHSTSDEGKTLKRSHSETVNCQRGNRHHGEGHRICHVGMRKRFFRRRLMKYIMRHPEILEQINNMSTDEDEKMEELDSDFSKLTTSEGEKTESEQDGQSETRCREGKKRCRGHHKRQDWRQFLRYMQRIESDRDTAVASQLEENDGASKSDKTCTVPKKVHFEDTPGDQTNYGRTPIIECGVGYGPPPRDSAEMWEWEPLQQPEIGPMERGGFPPRERFGGMGRRGCRPGAPWIPAEFPYHHWTERRQRPWWAFTPRMSGASLNQAEENKKENPEMNDKKPDSTDYQKMKQKIKAWNRFTHQMRCSPERYGMTNDSETETSAPEDTAAQDELKRIRKELTQEKRRKFRQLVQELGIQPWMFKLLAEELYGQKAGNHLYPNLDDKLSEQDQMQTKFVKQLQEIGADAWMFKVLRNQQMKAEREQYAITNDSETETSAAEDKVVQDQFRKKRRELTQEKRKNFRHMVQELGIQPWMFKLLAEELYGQKAGNHLYPDLDDKVSEQDQKQIKFVKQLQDMGPEAWMFKVLRNQEMKAAKEDESKCNPGATADSNNEANTGRKEGEYWKERAGHSGLKQQMRIWKRFANKWRWSSANLQKPGLDAEDSSDDSTVTKKQVVQQKRLKLKELVQKIGAKPWMFKLLAEELFEKTENVDKNVVVDEKQQEFIRELKDIGAEPWMFMVLRNQHVKAFKDAQSSAMEVIPAEENSKTYQKEAGATAACGGATATAEAYSTEPSIDEEWKLLRKEVKRFRKEKKMDQKMYQKEMRGYWRRQKKMKRMMIHMGFMSSSDDSSDQSGPEEMTNHHGNQHYRKHHHSHHHGKHHHHCKCSNNHHDD